MFFVDVARLVADELLLRGEAEVAEGTIKGGGLNFIRWGHHLPAIAEGDDAREGKNLFFWLGLGFGLWSHGYMYMYIYT